MVLRVQGSGCYWAFESGFFWSRVSSLGLKGGTVPKAQISQAEVRLQVHPPSLPRNLENYMSYCLNSLNGAIWGIIQGTIIGVIKGDTRATCVAVLIASCWVQGLVVLQV